MPLPSQLRIIFKLLLLLRSVKAGLGGTLKWPLPQYESFLCFQKLHISGSGPGRPHRPQHVRTLVSPRVNFFPEAEHTGQVDDPPPRGTSRRHVRPGVAVCHLHIQAFPGPLSVMKRRSP